MPVPYVDIDCASKNIYDLSVLDLAKGHGGGQPSVRQDPLSLLTSPPYLC